MNTTYITPQMEVVEIELESYNCLTLSATLPGADNDNNDTRSVR